MDQRLENALEFSKYMATMNNQKRIIREQFLESCIHYINGGKFSVNRELITFCHTLLQNDQTGAVLIDDNETPIDVEDLQKFLDDILDIYFTASYKYLDKHNEIKSNRTIEGLVNL